MGMENSLLYREQFRKESAMNIQLISVSKEYNGRQVLKEVDLNFLEGRINCLMGPSGIGKTTVMNLLMKLDTPDSGRILGMEGRRVAVCFQEDRLIEDWDAVSNVQLVCGKKITKEMIEKEFSKVGLEDSKDKPVRTLSGGMRRRVAMIRAMIIPSDVILMDEPLKGLDEELKYKVIDYIKEKSRGKTVIIITHEIEEAKRLGGNIVELK